MSCVARTWTRGVAAALLLPELIVSQPEIFCVQCTSVRWLAHD
eukprot:CAMPEP_0174700704 /NCGR_PEP_ID=MMETSP1094-20130205/5578_1 /TAXON_ID=156173 /ORGANISM="Chrysochromulina brevifilum, Strain UTEX LB 985" /LENGTH=42 /DNA_ID= /DNA_START= /DNA_END= /DNA_ORIENTATION=